MSAYQEQILIVEDDSQIRSFIGYALGGEGFRCLPVTGGQAALDVMRADNMDLVLLDLGLPDVDGMEVIRQLRQWSEVPIIVVSARAQDREKAAALDGGADDYLTKPFSATELLARIRVALRHRAPQPHNLMGLWLEAQGDQLGAMKHYRAACDLDPTYRPAAANLDRLGRLDGEGQPAYAPEDVLSRPRAIRRWAQ